MRGQRESAGGMITCCLVRGGGASFPLFFSPLPFLTENRDIFSFGFLFSYLDSRLALLRRGQEREGKRQEGRQAGEEGRKIKGEGKEEGGKGGKREAGRKEENKGLLYRCLIFRGEF